MKKSPIFHFFLVMAILLGSSPSFLSSLPSFEVNCFIRFDGQYMDRIPIALPGHIWPGAAVIGFDGPTPFENSTKHLHPQFIPEARLSNIQLVGRDEWCGVKCTALIETDFFGSTLLQLERTRLPNDFNIHDVTIVAFEDADSRSLNGYRLRLRHAYFLAEFCDCWSIRVGQFWSQWGSYEIAFPEAYTLDIVGPAGYGAVRQPQVCLTYMCPLDNCGEFGSLKIAASVEKEAVGRHPFEKLRHPAPQIFDEAWGYGQLCPLLVLKAGWLNFKPLQFVCGGAFTQVRMLHRFENEVFKKDAWAAHATFQSEWGKFMLFGRVQTGRGLNRLNGLEYPDVVFTPSLALGPLPTLELHAVKAQSWFLGASYLLTPCTRLTGIYGISNAKPVPDSTFEVGRPFTLRRAYSWEGCIRHQIGPSYEIGLEYKYWNVRSMDRNQGHLHIVALTVWKYFSFESGDCCWFW